MIVHKEKSSRLAISSLMNIEIEGPYLSCLNGQACDPTRTSCSLAALRANLHGPDTPVACRKDGHSGLHLGRQLQALF